MLAGPSPQCLGAWPSTAAVGTPGGILHTRAFESRSHDRLAVRSRFAVVAIAPSWCDVLMTNRRIVVVRAVAIAGALVAASRAARADDVPTVEPVRSGVILEAGLGAGQILQSGGSSLAGIAGQLEAGYLITPRAAIVVDGEAVNHWFDDGSRIVNGMVGVGGQVWINDLLWVKGVGGLGWWKILTPQSDTFCGLFGCHTTTSEKEDTSARASAVSGTLGLEAWHEGRIAVNLQLRASAVFHDEGTTSEVMILLGFDGFPSMPQAAP
jgi:hypothetical protein